MNRRDFIKGLLAGIFGAVLTGAGAVKAEEPKLEKINLSDEEEWKHFYIGTREVSRAEYDRFNDSLLAGYEANDRVWSINSLWSMAMTEDGITYASPY